MACILEDTCAQYCDLDILSAANSDIVEGVNLQQRIPPLETYLCRRISRDEAE